MRILAILFIAILAPIAFAEKPPLGPVGETTEQRDGRMGWWRDGRFGMFIHWGIYAVPAQGEWYMTNAKVPIPAYEKYAGQFDPTKFDADKIAAAAQAAGMKYLVITAKHHDGFCMFKTATTPYNVVDATPWHTDPLALLSEACKKHDVKFCVYYSIMDWHHPDQEPKTADAEHPTYNPTHFSSVERKAQYVKYMKAQLKELIDNYHPALIWFDGEWLLNWQVADGKDLVAYLYGLDPHLIVNGRTKGGGDYDTPEQKIPPTGNGKDWETCMTINGSWGYAAADAHYKSGDALLKNLIDIASKGGNYLLNVGPTPEGEIPQPELDSLKTMGDWMKVNGDAIHGTQASPFKAPLPWGRATRKGDTVYLLVFDPPKDHKLNVPLTTAVIKAYMLADNAEVNTSRTDAGVTIELPTDVPANAVLAIKCAGPPTAQ